MSTQSSRNTGLRYKSECTGWYLSHKTRQNPQKSKYRQKKKELRPGALQSLEVGEM